MPHISAELGRRIQESHGQTKQNKAVGVRRKEKRFRVITTVVLLGRVRVVRGSPLSIHKHVRRFGWVHSRRLISTGALT